MLGFDRWKEVPDRSETPSQRRSVDDRATKLQQVAPPCKSELGARKRDEPAHGPLVQKRYLPPPERDLRRGALDPARKLGAREGGLSEAPIVMRHPRLIRPRGQESCEALDLLPAKRSHLSQD